MKKAIFIILFYLVHQTANSQFTTTLVVIPQPPGALISWGTKELTYIVSGQPGLPPRLVLIRAELKASDGSNAGTTNLAKAKARTVGNGTIIFYAADVIPLEVMVFNGKYKKSIEKTGKLPADHYTLCVRLVSPVDFTPVSQDQCRSFTLAAFQLPIPVMPLNEDVLDAEKAQTAITFRWTPVSPTPGELVKYIVTVFEIQDRQTPMQALRSNRPLLTKEVIATTQFIWQPQLSFIKTRIWADAPDSVHTPEERAILDSLDITRFIWTIQTVDSRNIPFGDGNVNGDGISEPNVFTIIKDRRKIKSGPPARILYQNYIKSGG